MEAVLMSLLVTLENIAQSAGIKVESMPDSKNRDAVIL